MKKSNNLSLVKSTEKALLFKSDGQSFWVSKRAIIESRKYINNSYSVVIEDWAEVPQNLFVPISLLELVDEIPPANVELTTQIKQKEFPLDLIEIQKEAVDFATNLKVSLIWLWTGSGKTKVGIDIANILFQNKKINRLIWITPPRGIEQIEKSFNRWLNPEMVFEIKSMNWFSSNLDESFTQRDVVIIDEAHRVKNSIAEGWMVADCQLADNIRKSIHSSGYIYGLTANTALNGELDLFGIFFTLCRDIIIERDKKLRGYIKYKDNRPVAVKSIPDLIRRTSPYIFHRSKKDYDSRQMIERDYTLRLSSDKVALMNRLYNHGKKKDVIFRQSIIDTFSRMVNCLHRADGNLKISQCVQIIQEVSKDDQIIIFGFTRNGQYSDMALMKEVCKIANVSFIELHGGQTDEENRLAINNFREGKYKILISTYGCGAEMLDFPNANHVILFGHSLNPIHRYQAKGRVDRIIQKKQTYLHNIYVENSVEGYVNMLYNRKVSFSNDLSDFFKIDELKILNNELA